MKLKVRSRIIYNLLAIGIVPLCILGIVILLWGAGSFEKTMYKEISSELQHVATSVNMLFDLAYPGDYVLKGDSSYRLYKGGTDITEDYSIVDAIKTDTGMDITLFYHDTRIITTVSSSAGDRMIGTGAPDTVIKEVFNTGKSKFYDSVNVIGKPYFAYYMPIKNSDGTIVGMIFVGKPSSEVDAAVQSSVYPFIIAVIVTIFIMSVCIILYAKNMESVLIKIRNFLSQTAEGNLNATLSPSVTRRSDELGQIGQSTLAMQYALRGMIETDPLTELSNRRSAHRKLAQIMKKHLTDSGRPFCVSIGDIDFFKKINDTYGHDCGDVVLKVVAATLREHMRPYGFVARWGGEEFLLVFDHTDLVQSEKILNELLNKLRETEIPYGDNIIRLTMSFGVTAGGNIDEKDLLCRADNLLYEAKETGRNQVVADPDTTSEAEKEPGEIIENIDTTPGSLQE